MFIGCVAILSVQPLYQSSSFPPDLSTSFILLFRCL